MYRVPLLPDSPEELAALRATHSYMPMAQVETLEQGMALQDEAFAKWPAEYEREEWAESWRRDGSWNFAIWLPRPPGYILNGHEIDRECIAVAYVVPEERR